MVILTLTKGYGGIMNKYISISEAAEIIGVTQKTLRMWDDSNLLKAYRTPGGTRKYTLEQLDSYMGYKNIDNEEKDGEKNRVFIYGRVSTKKQFESGNLERQVTRLKSYCESKGYLIVNEYTEVASGINEGRIKLLRMLSNLHDVDKIIVEYPDRLARFGLNYIKVIAKQNDVNIEFIEENTTKSTNEEMASDIISIITCFSAKLYGARGARKVKEILTELNSVTLNKKIT